MVWQTRDQQGLPRLLYRNLRDNEREGRRPYFQSAMELQLSKIKFQDVTEKLFFLYHNNLLVRVIIILKLWYNV